MLSVSVDALLFIALGKPGLGSELGIAGLKIQQGGGLEGERERRRGFVRQKRQAQVALPLQVRKHIHQPKLLFLFWLVCFLWPSAEGQDYSYCRC